MERSIEGRVCDFKKDGDDSYSELISTERPSCSKIAFRDRSTKELEAVGEDGGRNALG